MILALLICGTSIGIVLSLFGSGGSILALPALIYVFGVKPTVASSYSLFIVAFACLVGFLIGQKKNKLKIARAFIIALPSAIATFISRSYLLPATPEVIFGTFSKETLFKYIIAVMMLISGSRMAFKNHIERGDAASIKDVYFKYAIVALIIGTLTGFVGSGGGFLIVPAMVSILGFSMRYASKISLLIIFFNSATGIIGDYQNLDNLNYLFLAKFIASALLGIVIGNKISGVLKDHHQKRAFGYFLIMVSLSILMKELTKI